MPAHELNIAKEALLTMESSGVLGEEHRADLNFLAVGFSKTINGIRETMDKISHVPAGIYLSAHENAVKNLKKGNYSTLSKYQIRMPEGVEGEMLPWLETLQEICNDLEDIDTRLLKPLKLWVGRSISYPGEVEKLWLDNTISFIDVEGNKDKLRKLYSDKVQDSIAFVPMHKAYPSIKDFEKSGVIVDNLTKFSATILGKDLNKMTVEIDHLITRLIDENDRCDLMKKAPASTIMRLAEITHQAANELEMLSMILFQIRVASVAYSETLEKINKDL